MALRFFMGILFKFVFFINNEVNIMEILNNFLEEIYYTSLVLLVGSIIYIRYQEQITYKIFIYIFYLFIASISTLFILFSIAHLSVGIIPEYVFTAYLFLYFVACFIVIFYVLKKQFQCTAWLPYFLFTSLTIIFYYLPLYVGLILVVIVYNFQ